MKKAKVLLLILSFVTLFITTSAVGQLVKDPTPPVYDPPQIYTPENWSYGLCPVGGILMEWYCHGYDIDVAEIEVYDENGLYDWDLSDTCSIIWPDGVPGKGYYWHVRYHVGGTTPLGAWSDWSDWNFFSIDDNIGDVTGDCSVDISDLVCLSDYMFQGGDSCATLEFAENIACPYNDQIDISDLTWLVAYMFQGGPEPGDCSGMAKLVDQTATFEISYENGFTIIKSTSDADLMALQIELSGTMTNAPEYVNDADLDLFFNNNRVSLIDLKGQNMMSAGSQTILRIPGEMSIESIIAVGTNNSIVTARILGSEVIPTGFALHQNHPNPFNPETIIDAYMPVASNYSLTIFNVAGQKVEQFVGHSEAGELRINWDASTYASGVYFYKFDVGEFTDTKKMILMK